MPWKIRAAAKSFNKSFQINHFFRVSSQIPGVLIRKPNVIKVEIVKALKMRIQIPVICHSNVKSSSRSAISESARKRKIKANTDKNPRIAVNVADNLSFFIFLSLMFYQNYILLLYWKVSGLVGWLSYADMKIISYLRR